MSLLSLCECILVELQRQDAPKEMDAETLRKIVMAPYQLDIDSSKKKRRKAFAEAIETLQRNGSIFQRAVDDVCDIICLVQKDKRKKKKRRRDAEETSSGSADCYDVPAPGSGQVSLLIQQTLQQQIIDVLSEKEPINRKKLRKKVVKSVDLSKLNSAAQPRSKTILKVAFDVAFDDMVDEGVIYVDDEDGLVHLVGMEETTDHLWSRIKEEQRREGLVSSDLHQNRFMKQQRIAVESSVHSKSLSTWTEDMDSRLRQAHMKFGGSNWAAIAEDIQCGKSAEQCQVRWSAYANPAFDSCRTDPWTENEEVLVLQLVENQRLNSATTSSKVNWLIVGKELNRTPAVCKQRHRFLADKSLRQGRFTPEEDRLILQRAKEWGDKGIGLWTSLGKEMNRAIGRLLGRYNVIRDGLERKAKNIAMGSITDDSTDEEGPVLQRMKAASLYWTPDMDARLTEAHSIYGNNWSKVSEHVGHGASYFQCSGRWSKYLDPALHRGKTGPWSDEEIVLLEQLVRSSPGEKINWKPIGVELDRNYLDCKMQYRALLRSRTKRGRYSPSEDAVIRHKVAEWDQKAVIEWTSIGRELNRAGFSVQQRWTQVLRHKEPV